MSLGFQETGSPNGSGEVCTEITGLNAALEYAYDHGVVVVAAAGNDGGNIVNCPAAYPTVIAVGAIRYDGQRTFYSNGGTALDIVAPGGDPNLDQNGDGYGDGILQVTYCNDPDTMALYWEVLGWNLYTEFCSVFYAGTSMATPHVTGAVALILSEEPNATPGQVRTYLQSTARDYGTPGWDASYGYGLLDASAAVLMAQGGTPPPPTPPSTGGMSGVVTNTTGAMIKGAKISAKIGGITYSATTSSTGSYSLINLPLGTYDVTASANGYTSQTKSVALTNSTPVTVNFSLVKKGKK
jgi:subtilisin family serine protease